MLHPSDLERGVAVEVQRRTEGGSGADGAQPRLGERVTLSSSRGSPSHQCPANKQAGSRPIPRSAMRTTLTRDAHTLNASVLADPAIPDEQIGGMPRNTIGMSKLREVVSEGRKKPNSSYAASSPPASTTETPCEPVGRVSIRSRLIRARLARDQGRAVDLRW